LDQKVNFTSEKKTYTKGSTIILQGSDTREILFLNQGTIEIKRCANIKNIDESEILKNSKRVGVIESPSIFGVNNIINSSVHESSYVALTDCIITKYNIPSYDFIGFFKVNPPIALNILLTMVEQTTKRILELKKYIDFIGLIDKLNDNLMLIYLHANQIKKDNLYKTFVDNGGVFPPIIDQSFLTSDFSTILNKSYGDPTYDPKTKFKWEKVEFFKSLIKAKPASFISLLSSDIKIFIYIFQSLSLLINSINEEAEKFMSEIESKLNNFFMNNSSSFNLFYSISKKIKKSDDFDKNLPNALVRICRNIEHINKQLGGKEYVEIFPKYDELNEGGSSINNNTSAQNIQITGEPQIIQDGKYKKMFKDSTKVILSYSTLSEDVKNRIIKNLNKIGKIKLDDPSAKDTRVMIKNLQDDYFELYQNIFLKAIKKPHDMPNPVKLFIYFSFIDEKLINEKQIEFIYNSLPYYTTNQHTEYPIITLFDYLKLIYNKEEEPSLSDRGEFRKIVNKPFSKNEKKVEDTPQGRVDFEIDNMVKLAMRVTSDNMRAYIPYLKEDSFKGALSQVLVSPKKLDVFIKKIVAIDYSLFFRELTWKVPGRSELIQKEIKPYLIITPNCGSRVQMWQELVYNIRSSRARFLVPIIFNSDLAKNLVFACGHYRWNLNKALVTNWMDPVEGGLTGAYYDYETTYKKNPDLTDEAKEKIKKQINTIKIDRNRFAHDYYEWTVFESAGVPKLNKILRKIFYRFIPFPKEIREKISKLPVYAELDRKFEIVRDREFKKIEVKYKKYMEDDRLPDDLKAYLEMMQR
jgi:hypothetical protein